MAWLKANLNGHDTMETKASLANLLLEVPVERLDVKSPYTPKKIFQHALTVPTWLELNDYGKSQRIDGFRQALTLIYPPLGKSWMKFGQHLVRTTRLTFLNKKVEIFLSDYLSKGNRVFSACLA